MENSLLKVGLVVLLLAVGNSASDFVCENQTISYTFKPSAEANGSDIWDASWFIVIGTAGVRLTNFESADSCSSGEPTCNGLFRRETFYYGAERFVAETKINISTLFFDHCYAENYLIKTFINLFFQPQPAVTLYDEYCMKYSIPHQQFRLIISDLSSEISSKVTELSRLLNAPQLAYGAASAWLDDEDRYPLLLRYLPSTKFEAFYILEVAKRLNVSSIILFYPLTAYGISGKQQIEEQASHFGIDIKEIYSVARDGRAEMKQTLKQLLEDKQFISNSCQQMVYIGEESYLTPLVDTMDPIGKTLNIKDWINNRKRIITGITWTPIYYLQRAIDTPTCLAKGTIAGKFNQYPLLEDSFSVGMHINEQLFNGRLCQYLGRQYKKPKDVAENCEEKKIETRDGFLQNMYLAWQDVWLAIGKNNDCILHINQTKHLFNRTKTQKRGVGNHGVVNYDIYKFNNDGSMTRNPNDVKVVDNKFLGSLNLDDEYPNGHRCQTQGNKASVSVGVWDSIEQYLHVGLTIGTLVLSAAQIALIGYVIRWLRKGSDIDSTSGSERQHCIPGSFERLREESRRGALSSPQPSELLPADDQDSGVDNDGLSLGISSVSSQVTARPDARFRTAIREPLQQPNPYQRQQPDPYQQHQPPHLGAISLQSSSSFPLSDLQSSYFDERTSASDMGSRDGKLLMSAV